MVKPHAAGDECFFFVVKLFYTCGHTCHWSTEPKRKDNVMADEDEDEDDEDEDDEMMAKVCNTFEEENFGVKCEV